jgi:CysZ protein
MIGDFLKGARCALEGFRLMRTPGVRRYVALPLLINIILFSAAVYFAWEGTGAAIAHLVEWLPAWLDWLSWLLWPLFILMVLAVVFYTFTLVANLVGAPFNGLYAEKLEYKLTGTPPPSSGRVVDTLLGVKDAVISEFIKFGYLISRAIPLLILTFIPGLNVFAPLLWFVFGAWMLALEYLDYPMGNHAILFKTQRERARLRRGLMLGFGSVITVMTLIPILNFLAMPVAVAGATQLWVRHLSPAAKGN